MARIYQALQRKTDGRWDYTVSSDDEGWCHALGYCGGWRYDDISEERVLYAWGTREAFDEHVEKMRPFKDKFHTTGHETPAEAVDCYATWELDHELRFFVDPATQKVCQAGDCGKWTCGRAQLGNRRFFVLCEEHQTKDIVKDLPQR